MIETLLIYNFILLLACVCALGVNHARGGLEWLLRTALFLVLWVPAAIRCNIGTDYVNYVDLFNASGGFVETLEPAYVLVNRIVKACGGGVQWVFALMAALTYAPVAFGLRRDWILPAVAMMMLTLYLPSFSLMRQSLVIVWCMVAIARFIDDEHVGRVYLWICAASLFHASALLLLPFVLFRRIHIPMWMLVLALPVFYVLSTHGFIEFLFSSEAFQGSKYGVYANTGFNRSTELGSGLGILLRMLIPLAYIIYYKQMNHKNDLVLYLVMAYIVSYMLSAQIHIFNRLVDVFSFAPVLAFALMDKQLRKRLVLLVLGLLMFVNFQKTILANPSSQYSGLGITPYETIFDQD